MNAKTVTIYVEKLSPFTRQLKDDLTNAGVHPVVKPVDEDMAAFVEMYHLTHAIHTPVIKITTDEGEIVLIGYSVENKKKIARLLNITL